MIEKGKLSDVRQRMDFSRRRLELTETDADTQDQQQQIVAILSELIKEEEKKEQSQQQSGKPNDQKNKKQKENSSPNQQQQQSNQNNGKPNQSKSQQGGTSSNANGVAELKTYDGSPASPWSRLRDRNRDAANNAFKDKLPARYRELVEKYNDKADGED